MILVCEKSRSKTKLGSLCRCEPWQRMERTRQMDSCARVDGKCWLTTMTALLLQRATKKSANLFQFELSVLSHHHPLREAALWLEKVVTTSRHCNVMLTIYWQQNLCALWLCKMAGWTGKGCGVMRAIIVVQAYNGLASCWTVFIIMNTVLSFSCEQTWVYFY